MGRIPDANLADVGKIDLLMIPGGPGQEDLMEDVANLSFIEKRAEATACAVGLLKGKNATTHWALVQFLKYFGSTAVDERGRGRREAGERGRMDCRDQRGAAVGGVAARGEETAKAIQLDIQYAPEPPFDRGHSDKAPEVILARQ